MSENWAAVEKGAGKWDIVVVDEAQNAAKRGQTESQRHRLARRLSHQCDTMIMLSATPHDGSPESFASLMNMLDPTAIANPSNYEREDIEGLFIRRFKGDIKHQVDSAFLDRDVDVCAADATAEEETVYDTLTGLAFTAIDEEGSGDMLFRTTLEKALFSSPAACLETVENRIDRLEATDDPVYQNDLRQLRRLAGQLREIGPEQFSKCNRLLRLLDGPAGLDWDGSDPEDRLVIFSERQAEANIDDPASLMGVYDIEEEEQITADAIETNQTPEDLDEDLSQDETDVMEILLGDDDEGEQADDLRDRVEEPLSLYDSEFEYLGAALRHLNEHKNAGLDFDRYEDNRTIRLTATDEIKDRFKRLPDEIWPEEDVFWLSADADDVQESIVDARKKEHAWPEMQYRWRLHPLSNWADDKVVAGFHRNEAPILTLRALGAEKTIVVCSGNVPNQKGQSKVNEWIGVRFWKDMDPQVVGFDEVLRESGLLEERPTNPAATVDVEALEALVPTAVDKAEEWMRDRRDEVNARMNEKLNRYLQRLETLKDEHQQQLALQYENSDRPESIVEPERKKERRKIDRIFDDFFEWAETTMTIEEDAYIQVIAVLTGTRSD